MNKNALLAAALLVTGCASTPQSLFDSGEKLTASYKEAPGVVAGCMARNVEAHRGGIVTAVRQLPQPASAQELVIRSATIAATFAIVHIVPTKDGSAATIWMTPDPFPARAGIRAELLNAC